MKKILYAVIIIITLIAPMYANNPPEHAVNICAVAIPVMNMYVLNYEYLYKERHGLAARLEYTGAGINLRKQNPSPENIKKAVRKIMSDSTFKQKAEELQTDFAKYDSPSLAVELVEELFEKTKS